MKEVKALMGYPSNAHHGLGHRHNPLDGTRAYEVKKVLDKALADHRDPNPPFSGVQHDGLVLRYTQDPAPEASVVIQFPKALKP
jgi:hypothetical protein